MSMLARWWHKQPRTFVFRYKYLAYPFDTKWSYFNIEAANQVDADAKAKTYFNDEIVGKNLTTMREFYRTMNT